MIINYIKLIKYMYNFKINIINLSLVQRDIIYECLNMYY